MKEQEEDGKIVYIFDSTKGEINESICKAFEIYLKDQVKDLKKLEKQ